MNEQDNTLSPSYPAVSPASLFHQQESGKVLKMNATCGLKCAESLTNCAPTTCLAKMLLASSIWGSTKRFLTWQERATKLRYSYFLLSPSARGMSANELLSWALMFPTPLASDTKLDVKYLDVHLSKNGVLRKTNKNGAIWSVKLSTAAYYLTPVASDGYRSTMKPASLCKGKTIRNLSAQIMQRENPVSDKAALNPEWVEWLMGFPPKWTDVLSGDGNPKMCRA